MTYTSTNMEKHLNNIEEIISQYVTLERLRELLRGLTCEVYHLTGHMIAAKNSYNAFMYQWTGPVARGEIAAHEHRPELNQLRQILKAAQNVIQSLIMEISIMKKE